MKLRKREIDWQWQRSQNFSIFQSWSQGQEAGNGKRREDRGKEVAVGLLKVLKYGRHNTEEETSTKGGTKLIGLI